MRRPGRVGAAPTDNQQSHSTRNLDRVTIAEPPIMSPPCQRRHPGVARTIIRIGSAGAFLIAGCRTYEPAPIDLDRLERSFLERRLEPEGSSDDATEVALDLAVAEQACLLLNADLRSGRADAGVAEAAADWAGRWPDPVLGLDLTRLLASVSNPVELLGSIGFTLPVSGRLEVEKTRLGRDHARMLVELEALEWRTRLRLRDAWYRWSAFEAERATTGALVAAIDDLLRLVDALEGTGDLARVEARIFRLARLDARVTLTQLDADCETARLEVLRLIGLPPSANVALTPLEASTVAPPAEVDLHHTPDVRIALAGYDVAESTYEQAIRGQFPDVGLAPGYGSRDGYRQVGLGASIPIPIFNGNRQAVETALAARTAAAVDVERRLERTAADLAAARTAFDLAIRRLRLVEDELIPLVDTQFRELRTLADLGQFDTLVLLDGLVRRRDAVVGLVRGRRDAGLAANRILSIVGSPATEDDHAASSLEEPA